MGRQRGPAAEPDEKTCAICGRRIEWRKKWADDWEQVRYCSDACRRRRREDTESLERAVLDLLGQRPASSSICPSDVARERRPEDWRPLMEPVREAARRLVAKGQAEITQGGEVVDPSTAKGPIRIRRPR
ncbi:DUF2256 and DUF3253 domain-containing protein [Euzebya tangerina]|uniref:DUF2256 and DUF3253 domain-containing protein n=1 Tax=Euzebya tangerina TaxID=591198 RepID=UPI000E324201|nr:DUF2256 and DUF3253 domain-containing protein [Euzebya tangerina]